MGPNATEVLDSASGHLVPDFADIVCEHTFVSRTYSYALTEHDPNRPWIIRDQQQRAVELEDDENFFEFAAREHPSPRWSVELGPYQLTP